MKPCFPHFWIFALLITSFIITVSGPASAQYYIQQHSSPDTLRKKLKTTVFIAKRIELLNEISIAFSRRTQCDSAMAYCSTALQLAQKHKLPSQVASSYNMMGIALKTLSLFDEARREFEKGISIAKDLPDKRLLVQISSNLADCYYNQKMYEKAEVVQRRVISWVTNYRLEELLPAALNSLGLIYMNAKKNDLAEIYFKKCINTATNKDEFFTYVGYKNLGRVLIRKNQFEIGLKYLWKSISIAEHSDSEYVRNMATLSYQNLAEYYYHIEEFEVGIVYAKKALDLAYKTNSSEEIFDAFEFFFSGHNAMGSTREAVGQIQLPHNTYKVVIQRLIQANQQALMARSQIDRNNTNIALLREEQKSRKQLQLVYLLGFLICGTSGVGLFFLYSKVKRQKKFIEEHSIQLESKVRERTSDLQKAYDDIKHAVLHGQTIERKRVAADIHDHLGSVLSSVALGLEVLNEAKFSDQEKMIFSSIKNQVADAYDEMRLLSHNLLPFELERHGLVPAIQRLTLKVNLLHKTMLRFEVKSMPILSKNTEFHLYSIVLELVNNILKHSNAAHGRILFQEIRPEILLVEISDNGLGFQDKEEPYSGMGLQNVKDRVVQLRGKIDHSTGLEWNRVTMEIPVS